MEYIHGLGGYQIEQKELLFCTTINRGRQTEQKKQEAKKVELTEWAAKCLRQKREVVLVHADKKVPLAEEVIDS